MEKKRLLAILWFLIATFIFIVLEVTLPFIRDLFRDSKLFLIPLVIFCLLGATLLILSLREKVKNKLKKFLILTGASTIGFFFFIILHNAFYALNTMTREVFILNYIIEDLHIIFFLIAIFVCPIGFLVGVISSIVILKKEQKSSTNNVFYSRIEQ